MKKVLSLLMILMLLVSFAGCTNQEKTAEVADKVVEATEEKATEEKSIFPLTIKDGIDREVTIEKQPERVLSLVPSMTETVFALGKEDMLVGRTDYCDYPEQAADIASIGKMTEPNIEKITELDPDVILASTLLKGDSLAKLEELGFTVLVLTAHDSIEGTYMMMEDAAMVLGAEAEVAELVEGMKATIADIEGRLEIVEKKSVYYVVGFGDYGDYTATGETFISQLIEIAGGDNVAKDATGWSYSIETLVEKDPQIMICSNKFGAKDGIKAANGYKELTAVKEERLFEIDNSKLDRQGPRLAEGLLELAKTIHPEVFE